ncbi:MAG TPA: hypothetical protein VEK57_01470 [Thermoanaerobaculia bacterium]|nr:hypothetical protein [Thermoanaerobaculia bacterium]
MHPYGSDRFRAAGERVILQCAIPKSWRPRTPKSLTHAEYPGTAVLWDEQYFEVVEATQLQTGGVRYVLAPWQDHHTFRSFEHYNEQSEIRRADDFRQAQKQRAGSFVSHLSGIFLGNLPEPVQKHLENELGVSANRMTLLSCLLPLIFMGAVIWVFVDAQMRGVPPAIPIFFLYLGALLMLEAMIRFLVAMSQNRAMGTFLGGLVYIIYWQLHPRRATLPSPFAAPGESTTFTIAPTEEIVLRDKLVMKGPLLTLLTPEEQKQLAERYGFNYREHAFWVAWVLMAFASLGAVSGFVSVAGSGDIGSLLSFLIAAGLALEQVLRLSALKRGPAGSILGAIARPFVRDLLR